MKKRFAAVLFAVAAAASSQVMALPVTFIGSGTGPGPVPVSASAVFDISGSTFTITLRNTSPSNSGQDVPGSTLTGLFFFGLDKRAAHSNQADCQVVSQRMV